MKGPRRGLGRAVGYAGVAGAGVRLKRAEEAQVRASAREHLAQRLGRLRGLPQKVGQLLSLSGEREVAEAFRPLTESLEPLPLGVIEAELARSWGRDPGEVLEELGEVGIAASLGQVHRGRLRGGGEVAIKVQYPGVGGAVEQDLKALGWLSAPVGDLRRGFDLEGYRAELRRDLEEELDYELEAARQEQFRGLCAGEPWVVPAVHAAWCRPTVLVSDWEEGETLEGVRAGWSAEARGKLGFQVMRWFARTVLGEGVFHADPHEGNLRFREPGAPTLVVYDFGSVFTLRARERLLLVRLIEGAAERGEDDPLRVLVGLGFDGELLEPMAGKLPALLSVLLEPFRQPMQFRMEEWGLGERVADVLGEDRWNFRMAAPARLLFLMRAWQGLIHQLRRLERPVSWRIPSEPFLRASREAASALELPEVGRAVTFGGLARYLRVEVREGGRQKVKLSLPAEAVERIEDLIEPEVRAAIEARGVCVEERKREIRRQGYRGQEVFTWEGDGRCVRVWLE